MGHCWSSGGKIDDSGLSMLTDNVRTQSENEPSLHLGAHYLIDQYRNPAKPALLQFHRVLQSPLRSNLIEGLHHAESLVEGHDIAFQFALSQAPHHLRSLAIISVANEREL